MILQKKGSHVGMILSFAIFITFVVFLYSIFQPTFDTGEDKKATLNYIENAIAINSTADLTTATLIINEEDNPASACVIFQGLLTALIDEIPNARMIIKNEQGIDEDAYIDVSNYGLKVNRANAENLFHKIHYSTEFNLLGEQAISSCTTLSESEYSIGGVNTEEYVFQKNIAELAEQYEANYEGIKSMLNIPAGVEFEFIFTLADGNIISASQETKPSNVYAEEIPVEYADLNANVQSGFINVRVW